MITMEDTTHRQKAQPETIQDMMDRIRARRYADPAVTAQVMGYASVDLRCYAASANWHTPKVTEGMLRRQSERLAKSAEKIGAWGVMLEETLTEMFGRSVYLDIMDRMQEKMDADFYAQKDDSAQNIESAPSMLITTYEVA